MNDEDVELTIEIKFENKTIVKKSTKEIKLEDLIKQCISEFKIDKKVQKKLFFTCTDTDGNIKKIEKTDDFYKYSTEIDSDEKYSLNINLKIASDTNDNKEEDNYIESVEYDKDSEDILKEKDKRIKELEETIEKMKKEQSEKLNKSKSDNILTDSETVTGGHTSSLEKNEKDELEKIIAELFQKEKNKFISDIQKIKEDIIKDIKKEQNKDNTNYDEFEEIKKNIEELNKDIEKINDIQIDLSTIK